MKLVGQHERCFSEQRRAVRIGGVCWDMVHCDALASISNDDLFTTAQRLTAQANIALADLLGHLGEIERRGIHRLRACASLYTYCIYELRMSEDAAYRRSKAARLVREYPELYDAIAKGELHLTGVLMIGPHLGGERHAEILRRARFRSKRELLRLIAELDPKPEVPALVEPIGPAPPGRATHAAFVEALSGPIRQFPPGKRPEDWLCATADSEEDWIAEDSEDAARCDDPNAGAPGTPGAEQVGETAEPDEPVDAGELQRALRYRVQFTASQEFVDLLEEASDLIGHEVEQVTLPEIQTRALRALVQQLRARKRAATKGSSPPPSQSSSPAPARAADVPDAAPVRATKLPDAAPARAAKVPDAAPARSGARRIPASVRRAVFERDCGRCAYQDDRGERCRETFGLEVHHRHAYALGGSATFDNLELRCRPHNALAAEEDFGKPYMESCGTTGTIRICS